jgi:hypothetical protein
MDDGYRRRRSTIKVHLNYTSISNQIKFIYIALRTSGDISKCCTETQPKTPNSKQCRCRSTVSHAMDLSISDFLFYYGVTSSMQVGRVPKDVRWTHTGPGLGNTQKLFRIPVEHERSESFNWDQKEEMSPSAFHWVAQAHMGHICPNQTSLFLPALTYPLNSSVARIRLCYLNCSECLAFKRYYVIL